MASWTQRESDVARAAAVVVGVLFGIGSWTSHRSGDSGYAIVVGLGAILFLIIALLLPLIIRFKVSGSGFEIDLGAEREAAAKAADAGVSSGEVAQEIASNDQTAATPSPQDRDVIGTLNYVAGNMALQAVFDWSVTTGAPLEGCQLRLYLLDEEEGLLKAVLAPQDVANAAEWKIGQGATGAAYESGDYVFVAGAAVSDSTYGLTDEQQERFQTLAAVAAAPVYNSAGTVLGVVTAATPALDHRLDTDEGRRDHTLAALLVSRILIELLQWFDDA